VEPVEWRVISLLADCAPNVNSHRPSICSAWHASGVSGCLHVRRKTIVAGLYGKTMWQTDCIQT